MQNSRLFRFRRARGAGLLGVTLLGYLLAVGCSGQSTRSSDVDPAGGATQADGGKHAAGSKAGGGGSKTTAGGSTGKSGSGGSNSNLGGNASAGNGHGG
ncbi:MAG TPA: hypothetical protein VNG33_16135, partial [Polyangiaceae bacterium]|nr:hypothetical protein [Polyangiaceae bacterium]